MQTSSNSNCVCIYLAIYLTVGGHKANGELIESVDTDVIDDTGGHFVPHFGYIFNDTDDAVYRQWFLTLHAITNTSEEYIYGYANNFIEIPSTICDHSSSYTFGFQDIWQGTWDAVCCSESSDGEDDVDGVEGSKYVSSRPPLSRCTVL